MSGYLAKPLRRAELAAALRQGLSGKEQVEGAEERASADMLDEGVLRELRESLGLEALAALLAVHREQLQQHTESLEQAFEQGDLAALAARAHRLKGESGSLGGRRLADSARRLELAARDERHDEAAVELRVLQASIPVTLEALESWLSACQD